MARARSFPPPPVQAVRDPVSGETPDQESFLPPQHPDAGEPGVQTPAPPADTPVRANVPRPPAAGSKRRWRVHLQAPTPLAHNPLEVEAATEEQAWEAFMQANGISGSMHERTIVPV